jgi:hypothetical protein
VEVRTRRALNRWNGTTMAGRALARACGLPLRPGPLGTWVAAGYRLPVPDARCFVLGDVLFSRAAAGWLYAPEQRRLLAHELRHTYQYARLGPAFWPLYWAACGWSYALTGSVGARNAFERGAGLADGNYAELPLRRTLRKLLGR